MTSEEFCVIANNPKNLVIDIRNKSETDQGKCHNAKAIPLGELGNRINELPKDKEVYIYC